MGLELQIEELMEQAQRAEVQGRDDDAQRLSLEVDALQAELAATADRAALEDPSPDPGPELHNAEELSITDDPD